MYTIYLNINYVVFLIYKKNYFILILHYNRNKNIQHIVQMLNNIDTLIFKLQDLQKSTYFQVYLCLIFYIDFLNSNENPYF